MIRVTGTLNCRTEAEAVTVSRYLPDHILLSRAEPGCLTFNVLPTASPLVWHLDETFTDRAAFDAHQARTGASAWFRATQGMPRDFQIDDSACRTEQPVPPVQQDLPGDRFADLGTKGRGSA